MTQKKDTIRVIQTYDGDVYRRLYRIQRKMGLKHVQDAVRVAVSEYVEKQEKELNII